MRENEQLFRLLVDGVKDYAIFALDPLDNVVSSNTGAQNIKGYVASEIIGTHVSRFYTPEDLMRKWPERELEMARAEGRMEEEGWRVRKDETRFWANVVITALDDRDARPRTAQPARCDRQFRGAAIEATVAKAAANLMIRRSIVVFLSLVVVVVHP